VSSGHPNHRTERIPQQRPTYDSNGVMLKQTREIELAGRVELTMNSRGESGKIGEPVETKCCVSYKHSVMSGGPENGSTSASMDNPSLFATQICSATDDATLTILLLPQRRHYDLVSRVFCENLKKLTWHLYCSTEARLTNVFRFEQPALMPMNESPAKCVARK